MGDSILFAEAATCQLEYKYLAKLTGRAEYYEKVSCSWLGDKILLSAVGRDSHGCFVHSKSTRRPIRGKLEPRR